MSIVDFTADLFHDPADLRAFVDDPDQALSDAGLAEATAEQVLDLLPTVAEPMPPDHPLQTVVHPADPVRALAELDIDELVAEVHHHHHETQLLEKELGPAECKPDDDEDEPAETIHIGRWDVVTEGDKALGDVSIPPIEDADAEPVDEYPDDSTQADEASDDHAIAEGFVDTL